MQLGTVFDKEGEEQEIVMPSKGRWHFWCSLHLARRLVFTVAIVVFDDKDDDDDADKNEVL